MSDSTKIFIIYILIKFSTFESIGVLFSFCCGDNLFSLLGVFLYELVVYDNNKATLGFLVNTVIQKNIEDKVKNKINLSILKNFILKPINDCLNKQK